jgi:hypothetical protein
MESVLEQMGVNRSGLAYQRRELNAQHPQPRPATAAGSSSASQDEQDPEAGD